MTTIYHMVICNYFFGNRHKINGNKVSYQKTVQRQLLTAFLYVPLELHALEKEISYLLKLLCPDIDMSLSTEHPEAYYGSPATTTLACISASWKFEGMLATGTLE